MSDELGDLALRRLAKTLSNAEDPRVVELFRDDRWLLRQVSNSLRDWDNYEADLSLAFDYLAKHAARHPDLFGQILVKLIKLAMVQSTLVTAENVPLEVVTAAVRAEIWPIERALSSISRYAKPADQALAYVSLMNLALDPVQRLSVERAFVSLAYKVPSRIPQRTLLKGISSISPIEQRALASRFAEVCRIYPNRRWSYVHARATGSETDTAEEVFQAMIENQAFRQPPLVAAALDSLLTEARAIADRADEAPSDTDFSTVQDVQDADQHSIIFGDFVARTETLQALNTAAMFLDDYGKASELAGRLDQCMGCTSSEEEWNLLSTQYKSALDVHGVEWQPAEFRLATKYASNSWQADQERLYFFRQTMILSGNVEQAHLGTDEVVYAYPGVEYFQQAWVARAFSRIYGANSEKSPPTTEEAGVADEIEETGETEEIAERSDDGLDASQQFDDGGNRPFAMLENSLQRAMAPVVAVMAVAFAELPPSTVDELIPEAYDAEQLPLQIFTLRNAIDDARIDRPTGRRAVGALLLHALRRAYEQNAAPTAWTEIDDESIRAADLTPVVDFVETLPLEPERGYAADLLNSGDLDLDEVPILIVLEVVAPYLDGSSAARIMALLETAPTLVRNYGVARIADYLDADALQATLLADWKNRDGRELAWAISEVAYGCSDENSEVLADIEQHVLEAAEVIDVGWAYVDTLLHRASRNRVSAAVVVEDPRVLSHVRQMSLNNKCDALRGLSHHANRDIEVPASVLDEILELPVLNSRGTYSWRAMALLSAAPYLGGADAKRALSAAMELPERLQIGPSQAWGRDWTTEYCRASTVLSLITKLAPPDMLDVFVYATSLPYSAREPLFKALGSHVSEDLARTLFDTTVEQFERYNALSDLEPPFEVDGTICIINSEMFKMHRRVETSEIIQEVLPKLDSGRLLKAAEFAFDQGAGGVTGPCAWLGGKLLGLTESAQNINWELLTAAALVDAFALVASEPSRIDVLIDLLPHVLKYGDTNESKLREFVQSRFPGHDSLFLERSQGEVLDADDLNLYLKLSGIGLMPRPSDGETYSEVELRGRYMSWILSPMASRERSRLLVVVLRQSPVLSRLLALPRLTELLPEQLRIDIVESTIRDIAENSNGLTAEGVSQLAGVVGDLPEDLKERFIELAPGFPSFEGDQTNAERRMFDLLYEDWGKVFRTQPQYDKYLGSVAARYQIEEIEARELRETTAFVSLRVRFVEQLADGLSTTAVSKAVQVCTATFSEIEQAEVLSRLVQGADSATKQAIVEQVLSFTARFARLWGLLRLQAELEDVRDEFRSTAQEIVHSFDDSESVGASAVFLVGYLGREYVLNTLLEQCRKSQEAERFLRLIALAARIVSEPAEELILLEYVCKLPTWDDRYKGLLALSRARIAVGARLRGPIAEAGVRCVIDRLRELALVPRADFLRELAAEMAVFQSFWSDADRKEMADSLSEVCLKWRWI